MAGWDALLQGVLAGIDARTKDAATRSEQKYKDAMTNLAWAGDSRAAVEAIQTAASNAPGTPETPAIPPVMKQNIPGLGGSSIQVSPGTPAIPATPGGINYQKDQAALRANQSQYDLNSFQLQLAKDQALKIGDVEQAAAIDKVNSSSKQLEDGSFAFQLMLDPSDPKKTILDPTFSGKASAAAARAQSNRMAIAGIQKPAREITDPSDILTTDKTGKVPYSAFTQYAGTALGVGSENALIVTLQGKNPQMKPEDAVNQMFMGMQGRVKDRIPDIQNQAADWVKAAYPAAYAAYQKKYGNQTAPAATSTGTGHPVLDFLNGPAPTSLSPALVAQSKDVVGKISAIQNSPSYQKLLTPDDKINLNRWKSMLSGTEPHYTESNRQDAIIQALAALSALNDRLRAARAR